MQLINAVQDATTNLQCYDVHWKLLDTMLHGLVPQHRERVYIVAIKRCGRSSVPFTWPSMVAPVDLHVLRDPHDAKPFSYTDYPYGNFTKTAAANLRKAVEKITALANSEGREPESYPVVVDLGSSKLNMGIGYCPCLTSSRCSSRGYAWLQTARRLSTAEMFKLQGFTEEDMVKMDFVLPRGKLAYMLGNAFTKTAIARVLKRAAVTAVAP